MIASIIRSVFSNKSFMTNAVCALVFIVGYYSRETAVGYAVMYGGIFGLSGAATNWLAVYMIFEKVPFLFGSGIIITKFESFKLHIREIILNTFFEEENLFKQSAKLAEAMLGKDPAGELAKKVDADVIFNELLQTVMESSLGNMLNMFGGASVVEKLRAPFTHKIRERLPKILEESGIHPGELEIDKDKIADIRRMLMEIIDDKLEELTPKRVKELVEKIIREHMGWLVIWGGVFGFLIGAVCAMFF